MPASRSNGHGCVGIRDQYSRVIVLILCFPSAQFDNIHSRLRNETLAELTAERCAPPKGGGSGDAIMPAASAKSIDTLPTWRIRNVARNAKIFARRRGGSCSFCNSSLGAFPIT